MVASPHLTDSGPASRMEVLNAEQRLLGISLFDVFRVDPDRFPGTRDFGSEMLNDLEHDIRIADCGDIVHDDLLFREDGCRDHRQHRVLISADCDISGDFRSAVYDKAAHEICFPYGLG